jgi:hypothetical protein
MVVLPKDADQDAYVKDAIARHDHKAFQEPPRPGAERRRYPGAPANLENVIA